MYIQIFRFLGLAKVRRVTPKPVIADDHKIDLDTLRAVIVNRMHVLRDYTRNVTLPVFKSQREGDESDSLTRRARSLLVKRPSLLDSKASQRLHEVLKSNQALKTVHDFRERLGQLWEGATDISNEKLLKQFRDWIAQAEASGIRVLHEFAQELKTYRLQSATATA